MHYPNIFRNYPEIEIAYLFGSRARGNYSPISDYDFAVQLKNNVKPRNYIDIKLILIKELCRALKTDRVDVVILNEAPLLLKHRIIKDKRLLFCRSQLKRIRLESQILINYLDFKEYEVAFSKGVFKRILEAA
jgi:predicted nucleotidyltransferase